MNQRDKETIDWFKAVCKMSFSFQEGKNLSQNRFWGNVKYQGELYSTDFYDSEEKAVKATLHLAFQQIA